MSQQEKRKRSLIYVQRHFKTGLKKRKSTLLKVDPRIDDMTLAHGNRKHLKYSETQINNYQKKQQEKKLSIAGSHPKSKLTTWKDKITSSNRNIHNIPLSQTSGLVSTTREKAYGRFWNSHSKEWSQKLWCPIFTDSQDSPTNSSETSSNTSTQNSLPKINPKQATQKNSQMTSWQSYTYSLAGSMEKEDTIKPNRYQKLRKWRKKKEKMEKEKNQENQTMKVEMEEKEGEKKEAKDYNTYQRCRKIRLRVGKESEKIIRKWMRDARRTYNLAISYLYKEKNFSFKDKDSCKIKMSEFDHKFITEEALWNDPKNSYLLRTPVHIRRNALRQLIGNISSIKSFINNLEKKIFGIEKGIKELKESKEEKKEDIDKIIKKKENYLKKIKKTLEDKRKSKLNFKDRDGKFQRIGIDEQDIRLEQTDKGTIIKFYVSLNVKGYLSEFIDWNLKDMNLLMERGKFYVAIPFHRYIPKENMNVPREDIISGDLGCRTFLTGYSPQGSTEKLGVGLEKRIKKLKIRQDKLRKRRKRLKQDLKEKLKNNKNFIIRKNKYKDEEKECIKFQSAVVSKNGEAIKYMKRHRRRMKVVNKLWHKIEKRVNNIVKDFHYKTSHKLCRNYHTIIISRFSIKGMVKNNSDKKKVKLSKTTKRALHALGFSKFRQILVAKASEYPGTNIITMTEEYTSKTCSMCGTENKKLGSSKVFKCGSCSVVMDRDMNGARNILIKTLV